MAHILCVMASPRKSGNSASAALDALDCLHTAGHTSEPLWLREYAVAPCVACGVCDKPPYACPLDGERVKTTDTAQASVQDDAHELLERIRRADVLLLASPVYFYGPPALFKALIDRSQRYWAVDQAKIGQSPVSPAYGDVADSSNNTEQGMKPAFMVLTAARPAGPKLFDASLLIYRSFLSCMGFTLHDPLCLRGLDERQAYARALPYQEQVRKAGTAWIGKL